MGYGEVVGNESVHWRVVHEEYEERGAVAAAATKGVRPRLARARLRTADVPPDTPATHIANLDVLDYEARGMDTIDYDQIGYSKEHASTFRVALRFKTEKEAKAAARQAQKITRLGKMYVITVDVPVIKRKKKDVGPPPNPPAEVRVDW